MKRIDRIKEEIEVFNKAVKYLTRYKVDKCKGYAPGCPNCQNQLLVGHLYDHISLLEWELDQDEKKK